jgi:hypothetical protein
MTSTSIPIVVPSERVLPVLSISIILAGSADFLFWEQPPGASIALFACLSALTLFALPGSGTRSRSAQIGGALLLASSLATLLEVSFSNVVVLSTLLAVIMGERHFRALPAGWARWSEAIAAWTLAPGRWLWLIRTFGEGGLASSEFGTLAGGRAARFVQILAPTVFLTVIFGIVLSFGNAVFAELLAHAMREVIPWIFSFDLSFPRTLLWIVFATFALALVRPHPAPASPRKWTRPLPRFVRPDAPLALWQSCAVFLVLNALFFAVNTIDVIYLWGQDSRAALPENVTFSAFVHQGIYSLIFAVLLSAVVIAFVFQQEAAVTRHRVLKALAGVWIAQNLLLIAGVFLRLKLYVDAYQLTEQRVYVGCFLILVTAGFALLARHVAEGGDLGTLLWRNVLATFVLFLVIQFPDAARWVAEFNVGQWQREPARTLDLAHLDALGPGAWPALIAVASLPDHADCTVMEARERVLRMASRERNARVSRDWRSFQARRQQNGRELIEAAARLQSSP